MLTTNNAIRLRVFLKKKDKIKLLLEEVKHNNKLKDGN